MKYLLIIWLYLGQGYGLTLNLDKVPIRDALQDLAKLGDKNLVISPQVKGNISLALNQVSWQHALDAIVASQNLGAASKDNIIYIQPKPSNTYQYQEIHLHYLPVKTAARLIKTEKLLSPNGRISFDDRSNVLLIHDGLKPINTIKKFLQSIDIAVPQISIKARIAAVDERAIKEWGIKLHSIGTKAIGNHFGLKNLTLNNGLTNSAGKIGLSIGSLPTGFLLDLELQALEAEDEGKVISAPHLTVSNQQTASIEQGSEVPYATINENGSTQVQFKKAVLGLQVTPDITTKHGITLKLQISKDHVTQYSGAAGNTPIIATAHMKTKVWLESGKTIVLGGIFVQENENDIKQVPWLGNIPLIGAFFRHQSKLKHKAELLIFVTPNILK